MIFKIQYVISFALEFVVFQGRVHTIHNFHKHSLVMQKVVKTKGAYSFCLKKEIKTHCIQHMSGLIGIYKSMLIKRILLLRHLTKSKNMKVCHCFVALNNLPRQTCLGFRKCGSQIISINCFLSSLVLTFTQPLQPIFSRTLSAFIHTST